MSNSALPRSVLLFSVLPWTCVVVAALNIPRRCGWFFSSCPSGLDMFFMSLGYIFSITILIVSSILWRDQSGKSASSSLAERDLILPAILFNTLYLVLAIPAFAILGIVFSPGLLNLSLL
jgi:hypothetical protein